MIYPLPNYISFYLFDRKRYGETFSHIARYYASGRFLNHSSAFDKKCQEPKFCCYVEETPMSSYWFKVGPSLHEHKSGCWCG